jgi:hypothetical protein
VRLDGALFSGIWHALFWEGGAVDGHPDGIYYPSCAVGLWARVLYWVSVWFNGLDYVYTQAMA